jgi:hypothetical protein
MLNKIIARLAAVRNEKAESMPAIIIGSIVGSLVMVGVGSILVSTMVTSAEETAKLESKTNEATIYNLLNNDVQHDFVRDASTDHLMFRLIDGDHCRDAIWTITDDVNDDGSLKGTQTLSREVWNFTEDNCGGIAVKHGVPFTITVEDAYFETRSHGGRLLTVSNDIGTLIADDAVPNPDNYAKRAASNANTLVKQVTLDSKGVYVNARNPHAN